MHEQLISQLYAAAAGRVDWQHPLAAIADALQLWAVQVIGVNKASSALVFDVHAGPVSPECALDYLRFYHPINPRIAPSMALDMSGWLHDHELFDDRFVASHPFFKDFLLPHGGRYLSGTKLIDDDHNVILLGLMRGATAQPLGPHEMPFLQSLKHHLSEAFHNHFHMRERYAEHEMARHLLDPFQHCMILVDDALGICHRNAAAQRLLASGSPLMERNGVLMCEDPACSQQILEAIDEIRRSEAEPTRQRRAVRLERAGQPPVALFMSAIRPEHAMRALGPTIRYLIIAHDPLHRPAATQDPLLLAELFGLTPAEARIAMSLAAGYEVKEIAQKFRLSIHTVRSQLRTVLEKTHTNRQAELVRLLLSLPIA